MVPTLNVDGAPVLVEIMSPGPHGISNAGLWLRVSSYKKIDDYLIISKEFRVIDVEGDL